MLSSAVFELDGEEEQQIPPLLVEIRVISNFSNEDNEQSLTTPFFSSVLKGFWFCVIVVSEVLVLNSETVNGIWERTSQSE